MHIGWPDTQDTNVQNKNITVLTFFFFYLKVKYYYHKTNKLNLLRIFEFKHCSLSY